MEYGYDALNKLQQSLGATGVLSKDYASTVMQWALAACSEAHAAGKAEAESKIPTARVGELDALDWSFIYASVSGPLPNEHGARAMFREDVDTVQTRTFNRLHRVITDMNLGSPLELRLLTLEPFFKAKPGDRYGPLRGTCYAQGGEFKTACGLPRHHKAEHSWESPMCLWRCENGHVIEEVIGQPTKCKLTLPLGDRAEAPCPAEHFIPLSACARRAWMDARDPVDRGGMTREFEAVPGGRGKGAKD